MRQRELEYDVDAVAEQGFYVLLGSQASAIPDPEYPWDPAVVKKIRKEFDPDFVPLFIRELWRTPSKGLVSVGRHACGRTIRNPHDGYRYLNVLLPTSPIGGIKIEGPILRSATFQVNAPLTPHDERIVERLGIPASRKLSTYVPFDDRIVKTLEAIASSNRNQTTKERQKEALSIHMDAQRGVTPAQLKHSKAESRYKVKTDWKRFERVRDESDYDRSQKRAREIRARAPKPTILVGKAAGKQPAPPAAKETS